MTRRINTIILVLLIFVSCRTITNKRTTLTNELQKHLDTITYSQNAIICDTCISTLIVEHDECTECSDLYVDSGYIFINTFVLSQFDSISKENLKDRGNIRYNYFKKLNTMDLCLDNKNDFYKLWPDTITWQDWGKKYRVKGIITKYEKSYLKFKIQEYKLLDTLYAKKFDKK